MIAALNCAKIVTTIRFWSWCHCSEQPLLSNLRVRRPVASKPAYPQLPNDHRRRRPCAANSRQENPKVRHLWGIPLNHSRTQGFRAKITLKASLACGSPVGSGDQNARGNWRAAFCPLGGLKGVATLVQL